MALVEYEVSIGGVPHKLLLEGDEAARRNTRFVATPFGVGVTAPPNVSARSVTVTTPGSAYPWAAMRSDDGRLFLGAGNAEPTAYIRGNSSSLFVGGALLFVPQTTGATDLGAPANLFRYARLSHGVQVGSFTTASRPSASTAGAGTMVFDSTLGKPIWSTGTAWVDATGETV